MLSPIINDVGAGPSGRSSSRSSTEPDGGKGTTMRSGFEGNGCASTRLFAPIATISGGKRHPPSASIAVEVHRVVADRAGLRGVLPLMRGLCGDRDHVALSQMTTHPALDTGPARLAGAGYLRVDHLAAGDELRFAIHDDEYVVGVVVHFGGALHAAVGDDDQALILEDAPALDEGGRNLVVVYVANARRKMGGSYEVHSVVADRAGFRRVLPLVRGLCGDRDHVALGQMMTHAAIDAGPARLAGLGCPRVDQLAAGDELRFAIHDDEHVVGVVVHLGAAPHDALGDDDQTLILDDTPALDEGGRNL